VGSNVVEEGSFVSTKLRVPAFSFSTFVVVKNLQSHKILVEDVIITIMN
jgi:hypothetical protein